MSTLREQVRAGLAKAVGADRAVCDEPALDSHSHDFWLLALQRRLHGWTSKKPLCVVRPQSHEEVAKIVAYAARFRMPIVPFGLGSGVCGGVEPDEHSIVLDLGAMNSIVALNDRALTVTVQAGMRGSDFEKELNAKGYSMGHFPQSLYLSSVGGWVATRASGQYSTRYGSIEDMVVAVKAVLPDGTTLDTRSVPRSSTGPDVKNLVIGSEGTLAVVTEVTYRIHPLPEVRRVHAFIFGEFAEGLEAIRLIVRQGWKPALLRLYDRKETKRHFGANGNENCMLLMLSEGPAQLVKVEMEACYEICMQAGGFDWGEKPVEHWLGKRFEVPDLRELALDKGVVFDTIEVAANWDKVGPLYDAVIRALKQVPGVLMASGHSSHSYQQGTCLYFTFAVKKPNWLPRIIARALSRGRLGRFDQPQDLSAVEASYYACWSAVMKAVLANGGTISHHHGVGRVRQEWIEEELGTGYAVLKRVKQALDPDGIMNPGTLFGNGRRGER